VNCIWFNLWFMWAHGKLLNTHCSSSYITKLCSFFESLLQNWCTKQVLYIQQLTHCLSDNSWHCPNQNKAEREEYLPPTPSLLIRNESLNSLLDTKLSLCRNHIFFLVCYIFLNPTGPFCTHISSVFPTVKDRAIDWKCGQYS
jgi:hypothetical protein